MTSDTRLEGERCQAIRSDGNPCTARAGRSGYCIGHQPNANRNRAKGGAATTKANRAAKLLPARLRPVVDTLVHAFYQVYAGELDPKRANSMATLANAIGRLFTIGEYEERLRQLEQNAIRFVEADRADDYDGADDDGSS